MQKEDQVDDITCVVIFLDRKLIERNLYPNGLPEALKAEEIKEEAQAQQRASQVGSRQRAFQQRRRSTPITPIDDGEAEFNNFVKSKKQKEKSPLDPEVAELSAAVAAAMAANQNSKLEDILNEENIIAEVDEFTTQNTHIMSKDTTKSFTYQSFQ